MPVGYSQQNLAGNDAHRGYTAAQRETAQNDIGHAQPERVPLRNTDIEHGGPPLRRRALHSYARHPRGPDNELDTSTCGREVKPRAPRGAPAVRRPPSPVKTGSEPHLLNEHYQRVTEPSPVKYRWERGAGRKCLKTLGHSRTHRTGTGVPRSACGTVATRIVKEMERRPGAVPGLLCPFAIISWLSSVKLVTPASYNLKRA